jgi:lipoprotein signal peptidase
VGVKNENMITTNVIYRVFHLHYAGNYGTCFAIDLSEKQYLVTAKHLIEGFLDGENIDLWYD